MSTSTRRSKRERPWQSYKWMRLQYVTKKLSEQDIADLAKTDQSTINRWLRRHGLKR